MWLDQIVPLIESIQMVDHIVDGAMKPNTVLTSLEGKEKTTPEYLNM